MKRKKICERILAGILCASLVFTNVSFESFATEDKETEIQSEENLDDENNKKGEKDTDKEDKQASKETETESSTVNESKSEEKAEDKTTEEASKAGESESESKSSESESDTEIETVTDTETETESETVTETETESETVTETETETESKVNNHIQLESLGEDFTYTVAGYDATITGYTGSDTDLTIPSTIDGYTVTAIGDKAFNSNKSIVNISFPNTIVNIGSSAFASCTVLKTVKFNYNSTPEFTCKIGNSAFSNCTSLTDVSLSENITSIGNNAFNNCSALTKLTLPESLTSMGYCMIRGTAISSITIPKNVTECTRFSDDGGYLYGALAGCPKLKSVTFEDGIEKIPSYILTSSRISNYVETVEIPNSVKSIGNCAFEGCTNLTSIKLPENLEEIGSGAFDSCNKLTEISIPKSIKKVGSNAFHNCQELKTVKFNNNDADGYECILDKWAFFNCGNLTNVELSNNIVSIGDEAFEYCTALEELVLPESLTSLGASIIEFTSISSITIPKNVKNCSYSSSGGNSYGPLYGCTSLKTVYFEEGMEQIPADIMLRASATNIVIPKSVKSIGEYAFYNATQLSKVELPENLESIGLRAFSGCTNLKTVTFNNNSDSEIALSISESAFSGCTSLESVSFSDNISSIGKNAFSDCKKLKSITFNNNSDSEITCLISYGAFQSCTSLENISFSDNITSIDSIAFKGCSNLENVTLPLNLESVGSSVFEDCTSLETVSFSDNVTSIGSSAFKNCYSLESITLSSKLKSIDFSAFYGCSSLESITLPSKVSSIGYSAFYGCSSLESITIPSKVKSVAKWTFQDCTNLETVNLSDNITSIGLSAFSGCSSLESITLPSKLTSIDSSAFANCTALNTIIFKSNAPKIYSVAFNNVVSDVYYPSYLTGWTSIVGNNFGGTLTWISYAKGAEPWNNDDIIEINGSGYAYKRILLTDNSGKVCANTKISYSFGDGESYTATSDDDGYVYIKSGLLTNSTNETIEKTLVTNDIVLVNKNEALNKNIKINVQIKPFSYSQTWELGLTGSIKGTAGIGADGTVGVAELEASIGKVSVGDSEAGSFSVTQEVEGDKRNLELTQNISNKATASAEIGPSVKAKVLGESLDVKPLTASASASVGAGKGIGLSIEDYDPDNTEQLLDIGKFMLAMTAQSKGSLWLLTISEKLGYEMYTEAESSVGVYSKAGVDVGTISYDDNEIGTLAGVEADSSLTYTKKRDLTDNSTSNSFSVETSGEINSSLSEMYAGLAGSISGELSVEINSDADGLNSMEIGGTETKSIKPTSETEQLELDYEQSEKDKYAVNFDEDETQNLIKQIKALSDFYNNKNPFITNMEGLLNNVDTLKPQGTYSKTKENSKGYEVDLKIPVGNNLGIEAELEAGLGVEGSYSLEYGTESGKYEDGKFVVSSKTSDDVSRFVNATSGNDIKDLFSDTIKSALKKAENFITEKTGEFYDSVKEGYASITGKVEENIEKLKHYKIHLFCIKNDNEKAVSYSIMSYEIDDISVYSDDESSDTASSKSVYTIGDPYCVYVTDENDNQVDEFSDYPLELSLEYTDDMLDAAGLTSKDVNSISIYMYSDDVYGYVCIGGTVDSANNVVTSEITQSGQYILATDTTAPLITSVEVTEDTNKPLITVYFDEVIGFNKFSFKLDGTEVVGNSDWKDHYNKAYNCISYQVENELADGVHRISVYAVDSAGNAMQSPAEYEFVIGDVVLYTVTFNTDENAEPTVISNVEEGATVTLPETPTKDGYTFKGWFTEKDGKGTEFTAQTKVTSDITLYAYFEQKNNDAPPSNEPSDNGNVVSYTVTFNTDENVEPTVISNVAEGATVTLPKNPTKDGYTFKGWFTEKGGKGTEFTAQTKVTSNITLYAYFEQNNSDVPPSNEVSNYGDVLLEDVPSDGVIPKGLWIAGIKSYAYTGSAIKPEVRVYDGNKLLREKRDYTISYKNNVKANDASVIVTGKGNYSGKETATFKILPIDINDTSIEIDDITLSYNNKVQKPIPVITYDGKKLKNKTDFTVSYTELGNGTAGAFKNVGEYEVVITAKGNFTGSRKIAVTITDNMLISKATVDKIPDQSYNGSAIEPEVTAKYKGQPDLVLGTDYTLKYVHNTEAGTATAILTGIGKYSGTKRVTFKINGKTLSKKSVTISGIESKPYNGSEQKLSLQLSYKSSGEKLIEGTDYKVTYSNNKKLGTASVTIKGINSYDGTIKQTFKITPFDIGANYQNSSYKIQGLDGQITAKYVKGGAKPVLSLSLNGVKLVEGVDYTLSYKNNKAVSENKASVTIKGKGNFKGTVNKTFTISSKTLADKDSPITLSVPDVAFVNKAGKYISKPVLTDADGTTLKAGQDYEANVVYMQGETMLDKNSILEAESTVKVVVTGKGNYAGGTLEGTYRITKSDFSKAKITVNSQTYTGSAITLNQASFSKVSIQGVDVTNNFGTDYEIVEGSYKDNINKGTASVTIRGKGNYGGSKVVKFKINSKGFLWWWRK